MAQKIATRFIDTKTGTEYIIGTNGSVEKVEVILKASDTTIDWTSKSIIVENLTKSISTTYNLNQFGVCTFEVVIGETYKVSFPAVGSYIQPTDETYTASLASRQIEHTYSSEETRYEQVDVHAILKSTTHTISDLDGKLVYATNQSGTLVSSATFSSGYCTLSIQYGTTYTIHIPDLDGHYHDHSSDTHVAGVVSRQLLVTYIMNTFGVCGRDATGKYYTIDEISALEDKSIIVMGSYCDVQLYQSSRLDGTTNNGFMWSITSPTTSGQWASSNVSFDTEKLPYTTNHDTGITRMAGKYYTEAILETAATLGLTTTMCTNAMARTVTIAGSDRQGFVPAYGQIKRLVDNRTQFEALYAALGKTAPTIWSGFWWTSCQYNVTYGVTLGNGGFGNHGKSDTRSVLVCFDL